MALGQSVAEVTSALASMLRTRLELFALEAGAQRVLLVRTIGMVLVGALLLILALLVLSLTIALAFWATPYRYHALGALVLVYGGGGAFLLWRVRQAFAEGPGPFSATLEELRNDLDLLERLRAPSADDDETPPGGRPEAP